MIIQIDTREHKWERARIEMQLSRLGVKTINSKLYVGDYQSWDNPRLVIDRKKDLVELCSNVTQQHERFRRELIKAQEAGINLIILCEQGDIHTLEDVYFWENPRADKSPKATQGSALYKSLCTIRDKYNVKFAFCSKSETGAKIVELLEDGIEERQGMDKTTSSGDKQ